MKKSPYVSLLFTVAFCAAGNAAPLIEPLQQVTLASHASHSENQKVIVADGRQYIWVQQGKNLIEYCRPGSAIRYKLTVNSAVAGWIELPVPARPAPRVGTCR